MEGVLGPQFPFPTETPTKQEVEEGWALRELAGISGYFQLGEVGVLRQGREA